ncbi:hypothetical protein LXA43DRAFT_1083303 [Ganoderma leucocontextum]|nr:hypothetical protein LXA43DRAFT_1083303 [Ganoderma leucocontextum]
MRRVQNALKTQAFKCPHCVKPEKWCKSAGGLTQHINSIHIDLFHSTSIDNPHPPPPPPPPASSPAPEQDHNPSNELPDDFEDLEIEDDPHADASEPGLDDADAPGIVETHPVLNAAPCDHLGTPLPDNAPPSPRTDARAGDWTPYNTRLEFELSEFLFKREQMSQSNVSFLLELWAADVVRYGGRPPFENHTEMFKVIDAIGHGNAPWQCLKVRYTGPRPDGVVPGWMDEVYEIWYRNPRVVAQNILQNPDFDGLFNTTPYREFTKGGERRFGNLMSGNWAWRQSDTIAEEVPNSEGCMFVPLGFGSDKTTVSVATGQNDYYPLYMFVGNLDNGARRAHRDSVLPLAFLAIPKAERKYADTAAFRRFRRQLFHTSLAAILQPLKPGMTTPEVVRCPDGHFRRAIWGIGPYIADYPEQVLVANIVQGWCPACLNNPKELDAPQPGQTRSRAYTEGLCRIIESTVLWDDWGIVADVIPFTEGFPRADISELLSGDLLHQLIKGTFKDHLVTWIGEYLTITHGDARGKELLDEIDRRQFRLAVTPPFPGLRHFKQGRDFKQWTGDDSKGLMKIYLPAISGIVPEAVVQAMAAFLEFCYLARRAYLTDATLRKMDDARHRFHQHRTIFQTSGVRPDGFSLPRQHSLDHYVQHIRNFGAPNGLCSSITEAKHIKAVKEPWRRSNHYEALGQMLLTNQRNEKLAAARADFTARGMLTGTCLSAALQALQEAMSNLEGDNEDHALGFDAVRAGDDADREDDPYEDRLDDDDDGNEQDADGGEDADDGDASIRAREVDGSGKQAGGHLESDGVVSGPRVSGFVVLARKPQPRYPRWAADLAAYVNIPSLPFLVSRFIYQQLNPDSDVPDDPNLLPACSARIHVYHSAVATFYAPSDPSGIGGMHHPDALQDMSCAIVEWFSATDSEPDEETGLWVVEPDLDANGARLLDVIDARTIFRSAHLIPVFGEHRVPPYMKFSDSLDSYHAYYVNRYLNLYAKWSNYPVFKLPAKSITVHGTRALVAKALITLTPPPSADDNSLANLSFEFAMDVNSASSPSAACQASTTDSAVDDTPSIDEIDVKYWRAYQLSLWLRTEEVNDVWNKLQE